ncbi:hypothetical protein SAMN05216389_12046 [Oceanobacillus limi]|uniref:DUF4025 domain-containing protein n=1 Tax=Oceanobacillus limi TaxID=930131 RepID=A0A1I0GDQ9_9BACI|nr:hypothetical protein [Oceanobacillus limi]SET68130.1 hypothetical protein SAMN05216389_12046 [Oceanobacillus limi]
MDRKKRTNNTNIRGVAPGIDPEDSYGEDATKAEIEHGESTKVTRLTYDEYNPSDK